MKIDEIIDELNLLKEGEYLFFSPSDLNKFQAARNSFFKSSKLFEISANKIIRLTDLKNDEDE